MKDTPIFKLLLKLSPPVMLALLIQSIYNIVDSYFVARYAPEGLTALSIIFPVQLLLVAFATGTGAGLNILLSRMNGAGERDTQAAHRGLLLDISPHTPKWSYFPNLKLLDIRPLYPSTYQQFFLCQLFSTSLFHANSNRLPLLYREFPPIQCK